MKFYYKYFEIVNKNVLLIGVSLIKVYLLTSSFNILPKIILRKLSRQLIPSSFRLIIFRLDLF